MPSPENQPFHNPDKVYDQLHAEGVLPAHEGEGEDAEDHAAFHAPGQHDLDSELDTAQEMRRQDLN